MCRSKSRKRTVIKYDIHLRPCYFRVQEGHSTQLAIQDVASKSGLQHLLYQIARLGNNRKTTDLDDVCAVKTINTINPKYALLLRENGMIQDPEIATPLVSTL